jgi:2-polyprenyl-3-methyl-5-hydroxy-6-metoxy-1,4-benzoquinol methylase
MQTIRYTKHPSSLNPTVTAAAGDVDATRHLLRYQYAWAVATKRQAKQVWDLGSGTGYGARILSEAHCRVTAVELDAETLMYARGEYGDRANLDFVRQDLNDVWTSLSAFPPPGVICCFEVIEQLRNRDLFFEQLVYYAKNADVLISCSHAGRLTPDTKSQTLNLGYSESLFLSQLRRYFRDVAAPDSTTSQLCCRHAAFRDISDPFAGLAVCRDPVVV